MHDSQMNATNLRLVAQYGQTWGMHVRDTSDPVEALAWIRRGESFDVAVIDMMMPGMDGIMLAQEIRKIHDAATLPLIMFSSLGHRESATDSIEFSGYLMKPLKPSQFFNILAQVLSEPERPLAAAAGRTPVALTGERYPLRILLAEDNRVNQMLALRLLEKMGYRPEIVSNGLEAVAAIQQAHFDVILMDVQMPEMDGLEATRQIRQDRSGDAGPRIVAMTANAMQGDREICLAAGMDDYVSKPIRVEDLEEALVRSATIIGRTQAN